MSRMERKNEARMIYNAQMAPLYTALEAVEGPAGAVYEYAIDAATITWRNTIRPAKEAFEMAKQPFYDAYYKIIDDIDNGVCPTCHDGETDNG